MGAGQRSVGVGRLVLEEVAFKERKSAPCAAAVGFVLRKNPPGKRSLMRPRNRGTSSNTNLGLWAASRAQQVKGGHGPDDHVVK